MTTKDNKPEIEQASPHPNPLPGGEGTKTASGAKRIRIGEISTAHGVRGLVKVRCFGDDPQSLQKYGPLYTSETGDKTHSLTLKHQAGGVWIAEVDSINDRNVAEKLRGTQLWINRGVLPEIEDGAFYHIDLEGMDVIDIHGAAWGKVMGVENFGASDLLQIKPENRPAFYLPFVDLYVTDINLETRIVTIDMPEGLVE